MTSEEQDVEDRELLDLSVRGSKAARLALARLRAERDAAVKRAEEAERELQTARNTAIINLKVAKDRGEALAAAERRAAAVAERAQELLDRERADKERMRSTLELVRAHIKDTPVAHHVVGVSSSDPSLLQVIDAALSQGGA